LGVSTTWQSVESNREAIREVGDENGMIMGGNAAAVLGIQL
jgi:hypothetical protein